MWADGQKEEEIRSEDSYVAASTSFLKDALTVGGRAEGSAFRFIGALDELKIEAISDSRPPAVTPKQLYILAGQSNALGQAHTNVADLTFTAPQPGAWIWNQGNWYSVQPGFGWKDDRFGPEVSFARAIRAGTADPIAIIKFAVGATSLHADWAAPNGVHYVDLKRAIRLARASIPNVEIAGILWMQGENDGVEENGKYASSYGTNLTNFIKQLRTDLGKPDLRFVIGQIHSTWDPTGLVRQAQATVAQTLSNVKLVSTEDLGIYKDPADENHFNVEGMTELGRRFADKVKAH
jgi:hypothetical protein